MKESLLKVLHNVLLKQLVWQYYAVANPSYEYNMIKRFFGAHVSVSGGLDQALVAAQQLEINTIQIHPSPPQRWNSKPFPPGVEAKFLELLPRSGVERIFFHGIYLINLANPDPRNAALARQSLGADLDLAARIGGSGVIFHVGSMKDEPDEKVGFARAAETINRILDESKNSARLILEVAAGSGSVIGDRVEELAEIYAQVENKERVGFGLDTQHMWASGYNWQTDLEAIVKNVDQVLGMNKVWSVHLNDSKPECGSRKDRHENIGDGTIGNDALRAVFMHPKLLSVPFILETPGLKDAATAKLEVDKIKGWL